VATYGSTYRTKRKNLLIATIGSRAAGRPGIYPIASTTNLGTDSRRRVNCHVPPFGSLYACPQNEFEARHVHHALILPGGFFSLIPAASQDATLLILQKSKSQVHSKVRNDRCSEFARGKVLSLPEACCRHDVPR